MSSHYGSDSPEVDNPFRQEGLFYLISGLVVFIIGVISLVTLREQIIEKGLTAGWFNLSMSLILVSVGITFLFKGFNKRSRFYVGRGAPSSLSPNFSRSESHLLEAGTYYHPDDLEQMLLGRKNPTFHEPVTLFDRMTYNVYREFLFLPYTMRNYLHILIRNTSYSFIALIVYLIALLSGKVGLTMLTESEFSQWLSIGLCLFLIFIWFFRRLSTKNIEVKQLQLGKISKLAWLIAIAILIPSVAEFALRQGVEIPPA